MHLEAETHHMPGRQHDMVAEYSSRIEAMQFVLSHDERQSTYNLDKANIILLGVSRTSKTPAIMFAEPR
jgi:regulator of PEP synthase PpsR (kinase-PPPase family)